MEREHHLPASRVSRPCPGIAVGLQQACHMRTSERDAHEVMAEGACGLECLFRGQRRDPEWRPRLLGRPRQRIRVFEAVESAAGRDLVLLEQAAHLLQSLLETGAALVHGDAETCKLVWQEGTRKSDLEATAGNSIHHPD